MEKTHAQDEDTSPFEDFSGDSLKMSPFDVEAYRANLNRTSVEYSKVKTNRFDSVEGRAMTISGGKPVAVDALVVAGSGLRSAEGLDLGRLCRTLAILQKKFGIDFRNYDVYVECSAQVEHSADLAVMAAVMSSLSAVPVRTDSFALGEIDLLGDVQPIDEENDLSSFSRIVCANEKEDQGNKVLCRTISEALDQVLVGSLPKL
jgi:predicted ATP-dependent serine protease